MINSNFSLKDTGASNALDNSNFARHRWYSVKEGFSPNLVEQAILGEDVKKGAVIFDPFSGSGTVPLTGALGGFKASAFEVNPFLRFLSAAKLSNCNSRDFAEAAKRVLKACEKPRKSPLEGFSTFTEGNRWNRWLFPTPVIRSFESGFQAIQDVDGKAAALLKLALIGGAMDCCNAERDGKCLRYGKDWTENQATASRFRESFVKRATMISEDLQAAPIASKGARILEGDSRVLIRGKVKEEEKFRICVTSPPYLNSFDYSDVYRPELFLGRFVDTNSTLMKVRLKTVRSHIQANWVAPSRSDFGAIYSECVKDLRDVAPELWSEKIPLMVQAYFEDMEGILRGLKARSAPESSVWLVVSTSAYAGVEVPVDLIIAEVAQRCGWFLREVGVLRYLRSASQHFKHVRDEERRSVPLRESVVILDSSKPKKQKVRKR